MNSKIYIATKEDIPLVTAIIKKHPKLLLKYLGRLRIVKQFLPFILVYKDDSFEDLQGFIHFGISDRGKLHICQMGVLEPRKGVGKALIEHLQGWWGWISVDCSIRNKKALAFYKRVGFVENGQRTFYNSSVKRNSTFVRLEWKM